MTNTGSSAVVYLIPECSTDRQRWSERKRERETDRGTERETETETYIKTDQREEED